MEEYKLKQKQRYEEYKLKQKEKEQIEEEKKLEIEKINKRQQQIKQLCNEGFSHEDSVFITDFISEVEFIMNSMCIVFLNEFTTVPSRFRAYCIETASSSSSSSSSSEPTQQVAYFFDLRLLMDCIEFGYPSNILPLVDSQHLKRLQSYWNIVNPYKNNSYFTEFVLLTVDLYDEEPKSDSQLQSYINKTLHSSDSRVDPFQKDYYYNANSVALPHSLFNGLMIGNEFNDEPLAVELCVPGVSSRLYAYCRNPDHSSKPKQILMSWRMKCMLKCKKNDSIICRVLLPPSVPKQLPGFQLITTTRVPESVCSESELKQLLSDSVNYQRILFPEQVIWVQTRDPHFGPIPFLIGNVYTDLNSSSSSPFPSPSRVACSVISVHGKGNGFDCAVETVTDLCPSDDNLTGKMKCYNYLKNLVKNSV